MADGSSPEAGAKKPRKITRRRGNTLEKWEVALVKTMIARGRYNNQDILAYFTRPTRSVNHRLIGEIRDEVKHKSVKPANQDAADELAPVHQSHRRRRGRQAPVALVGLDDQRQQDPTPLDSAE